MLIIAHRNVEKDVQRADGDMGLATKKSAAPICANGFVAASRLARLIGALRGSDRAVEAERPFT